MKGIEEDLAGNVRPGEAPDVAALARYLGDHPDIGSPQSIRQFPGGYSNLTYLLTTTKGEYILRRPPHGAAIKSAHDMGREFHVLSLLRPHYPKVPAPVLFCETPDVLGAPFYLMERMHGVILRPQTPGLNDISADEMRRISTALVDNLAQLHLLDIQSTGLQQLGKPEGYIARQVEGWSKRYRAAETDALEDMNGLIQWLARHMPQEVQPTLLHNDYKYDNLLLHPDTDEITGVLDWEMATVGDPRMDLGASLAYWVQAEEGEGARVFNISWLPGNLTRKEVVARYEEQTGRQVEQPVFFYAFGLFKNAVIAQQIYARWKQGLTQDPRFKALIHVIRDLARRGIQAIEKNTI